MYKLYCRLYQLVFRIAMYLLPWREPKLIQGKNSLSQLPVLLEAEQIKHILLVTDQTIKHLDFFNKLTEALASKHIQFFIFDEVIPNPTIENIEAGRRAFLDKKCHAIVAIGGGSVIDCAKGIAARIAKPNKTVPELKGQLKIRKEVPKLFAIPTTAGTGSEATVAAVISNSETLEKYPINDLVLIPYVAILDPIITIKLPPMITSTTGMDALTHAVEAYIGKSNTPLTRQYSLEAVRIIFSYLEEAYKDGKNIEARAKMQLAAYKAGVAFTRAYVGNIHAIAHTLGGYYQIPHGLANAVIMPYILRFYGNKVYKALAELADAAGIASEEMTEQHKAEAFIEAIEKMNKNMNIPTKLDGIRLEDIPTLVKRARSEANPLYPVPIIMNEEEMTSIYLALRS